MAEVSVRVRYVYGEPTPQPYVGAWDNSDEAKADYTRHLMHAMEFYPKTVSMDITGLTFEDVFEVMKAMGLHTPKGMARDFLTRLSGAR